MELSLIVISSLKSNKASGTPQSTFSGRYLRSGNPLWLERNCCTLSSSSSSSFWGLPWASTWPSPAMSVCLILALFFDRQLCAFVLDTTVNATGCLPPSQPRLPTGWPRCTRSSASSWGSSTTTSCSSPTECWPPSSSSPTFALLRGHRALRASPDTPHWLGVWCSYFGMFFKAYLGYVWWGSVSTSP